MSKIIPTGHASELHDCSSVGPSAHSVPPLAAWVTIFLDRTWFPLPLVTLQSAHVPHAPQTQSTRSKEEFNDYEMMQGLTYNYTWASICIAILIIIFIGTKAA